jgi:methylenetetrahydrofolate reductase (NADPH)
MSAIDAGPSPDVRATLPISFEFFPPKTAEGAAKLRIARQTLYALAPEFCSVTYGAGGSTQEGTFGTVAEILAEGVAAASHFSCIGATRAKTREQLALLQKMGVKRLVALRGDLPSGYGTGGEFHYASDLVAFIRAETGDEFRIEVACYPEMHPQARSPEADLQAFAAKIRAGADAAITQYFYNADSYFRFVEDADRLGLHVPVVPGVMPITSSAQLMRFSDACGAEIPRWIRLRLQSFGDDSASIKAFGLDVVTQLCEQLRAGGAPGLHFYTLNQAGPTVEICKRLGLGS